MKLKYTFMISEIGNEFIGVPLSNDNENFNGVLKFNKETAFIIELLNNDISYETLCTRVEENFLLSKDETKESIDMILEKLKEAELLED